MIVLLLMVLAAASSAGKDQRWLEHLSASLSASYEMLEWHIRNCLNVAALQINGAIQPPS